MIKIRDKGQCCGCGACMNVCPKKCIQMTDDEEGFAYPMVDHDRCVDCGLCETVCPFLHSQSKNRIQTAYGAENTADLVQKQSSCGGLFSVFAQKIIEEQGVVCACKLDAQLRAVHSFAHTMEELEPMRNSKYVQSRLDDTFSKVKAYLDQGITVFFSAMPCQVAGLKRFLRKPYDNLFTVDVLCHGVPSPKLFRDYLAMQETVYGSSVESVNFRDKTNGWKRSNITLKFQNGESYSKFCGFDPYLSLYGNNLSQRPSCFSCPFTTPNRQGDISIGDFSVIGRNVPYEDKDTGITLVLVNNEKGQKMFDSIRNAISHCEIDPETAAEGNAVLIHPISGLEKRNSYYDHYLKQGFRCVYNTDI